MDYEAYFSKENYLLIMNFFQSVMNLSQEIDRLFSISSRELKKSILDKVVNESSYIFIKNNYDKVFRTIKDIETKVFNLLNMDLNQNTDISKKDNTFQKIISKIDFNYDLIALNVLENTKYVPLSLIANQNLTYKVVNKGEFQEFFMKLYKLNNANSKNLSAEQRANMILNNHRVNVLQYKESFNIRGEFHCQIFPYGQSLNTLLKENYVEGMHEKMCFFFFFQIIKGVEFIHSKGIVHRNLNLSDIILISYQVKISNFSLCRFFKYSFQSTNLKYNSIKFAPPELADESKITNENWTKIDVFALGIILYQVSYGKDPFEIYSNIYIDEENINNVNYDGECSSNLKDLIRCCLKFNLSERYNLNQVKSALWFKEMEKDFYKSNGKEIEDLESIFNKIANEIEDLNNEILKV